MVLKNNLAVKVKRITKDSQQNEKTLSIKLKDSASNDVVSSCNHLFCGFRSENTFMISILKYWIIV